MASLSLPHDQLRIEAPVGSHAGNFFGSQYVYGFDRASTVSPYPYGTGTFKRLSRSNEKRTSALFAAFASLMAIVMLIYTCKIVYSRKAGSASRRRRLSDDGSDSDAEGLIICEDTDEEDVIIVSSPATSGTTFDEDDQSEPSSKLPRLESGRKRTEKTKHLQPSSGGQRKRPAGKHRRGSASELEGLGTSQEAGQPLSAHPSSSGFLAAQQQTGGESAGGVVEQTPGRTPYHPVAASNYGTHTQQPVTISPRVVLIQHSHVIWSAHSVPGTAVPGRSLVGPQPQPSRSQSQPRGGAAQGTSKETSVAAVSATGPTSAGSIEAPSEPQVAVPESPAAASAPQWKPFDSRYATRTAGLAHTAIPETRDLIATGSRNSSTMRRIARMAEDVVNFVVKHQPRNLPGLPPAKAVVHLAREYLLLDAAVRALHFLGEDLSKPWWNQFTARLSHSYSRSMPAYASDRSRRNLQLIRLLLNALAILDTGALPSEAQSLQLRTLLFHPPSSFLRRSTLYWREWEQTDRGAGGNEDEESEDDEDAT